MKLQRAAMITGIFGPVIILTCALLTALNYRGRTGEPYSIFNHFVSELGEVGISPWATVFNVGMICGNLCLVVLALGLASRMRRMRFSYGFFGVICALSAALVGVFPMNNLLPHLLFAMMFFYTGFASAIRYSIHSYRFLSGRFGRWNALPSFVSALCFAAFIIETLRMSGHLKQVIHTLLHQRPDFWLPPTLEWLVFLSVMVWITLAAIQLNAVLEKKVA